LWAHSVEVAPNIFGPSVWNLLHLTLMAPRIFRWFLYFCKNRAPLLYAVLYDIYVALTVRDIRKSTTEFSFECDTFEISTHFADI
jgi:hypothetical protein